ncbi:MAG: hypothetical protein HY078_04965 [Elusimicrobia bacterium]|nr:hypothetical protein [Elusimicrobiota bacterium]
MRFSSGFLRNLFRTVIGSRKRFCFDCGGRWISDSREGGPWPLRLTLASAPVAVLWGFIALDASRSIPYRDPTASPYARYYFESEGATGHQLGSVAVRGTAMSLQAPLSKAEAERLGLPPPAAPGSTENGLRPPAAARLRSSSAAIAFAGAKAESGGMFSGPLMSFITNFLKSQFGGQNISRGQIDSVLKQDKRTLWNKYGKYFGSKEEAKQAYEQVQRNKGAYGY